MSIVLVTTVEPLHSSVAAETVPGGVLPPIAKAEVLSAPAPAKFLLPVLKVATAVQFVPFHDSA